jgi:L-alanine-DL-glutamate epimerase-like enolase superfamily enzyme
MKITEVRTRVVEWTGATVPPQPHFCTNAMDLLSLPADSMAGFRFHGWLVVEIFTDAGHVGIGNAASPRASQSKPSISISSRSCSAKIRSIPNFSGNSCTGRPWLGDARASAW